MAPSPSVIYDYDPNNLPDDLLRAIGLMVAASAQTERIVQDFIGALLGIDQFEAIALTAQMASPLRDQVARSIIELNATTAGHVDLVDDLLDAIKIATSKRNVVVHNSFARNPETGEIFSLREKARGSLQVTLAPVDAKQVMKEATIIYEAGMDLLRYMILWNVMPNNSSRIPREPLDRREKARQTRRHNVESSLSESR